LICRQFADVVLIVTASFLFAFFKTLGPIFIEIILKMAEPELLDLVTLWKENQAAIEETIEFYADVIFSVLIILALISLTTGCLLVLGTIKKRHHLLLPFVVQMTFGIFCHLLSFVLEIAQLFMGGEHSNPFASFVMPLIKIGEDSRDFYHFLINNIDGFFLLLFVPGLFTYCILVMLGHRKELQEVERNYRVTDKDDDMSYANLQKHDV